MLSIQWIIKSSMGACLCILLTLPSLTYGQVNTDTSDTNSSNIDIEELLRKERERSIELMKMLYKLKEEVDRLKKENDKLRKEENKSKDGSDNQKEKTYRRNAGAGIIGVKEDESSNYSPEIKREVIEMIKRLSYLRGAGDDYSGQLNTSISRDELIAILSSEVKTLQDMSQSGGLENKDRNQSKQSSSLLERGLTSISEQTKRLIAWMKSIY